jgi:hypothetical protein
MKNKIYCIVLFVYQGHERISRVQDELIEVFFISCKDIHRVY